MFNSSRSKLYLRSWHKIRNLAGDTHGGAFDSHTDLPTFLFSSRNMSRHILHGDQAFSGLWQTGGVQWSASLAFWVKRNGWRVIIASISRVLFELQDSSKLVRLACWHGKHGREIRRLSILLLVSFGKRLNSFSTPGRFGEDLSARRKH